jgi:hypothetical protein
MDKDGVETRGIMKPQLLAGDKVQPEPEKKTPKPVRRITVKKAPAPVVTVAATKDTVEVIKGVHRSSVEFRGEGIRGISAISVEK